MPIITTKPKNTNSQKVTTDVDHENFFCNKVKVLIYDHVIYYRAKDLVRLFLKQGQRMPSIKNEHKIKSKNMGVKGSDFYVDWKGVRIILCKSDKKDIEDFFIEFYIKSKYNLDLNEHKNISTFFDDTINDVADYIDAIEQEIINKKLKRSQKKPFKPKLVIEPPPEESDEIIFDNGSNDNGSNCEDDGSEVIPEVVGVITKTNNENSFEITEYKGEDYDKIYDQIEDKIIYKTQKKNLRNRVNKACEEYKKSSGRESMICIANKIKIKNPLTTEEMIKIIKKTTLSP
nr:MAG: hypothetical protein DiTV3a_F5ORF4 [Diabrotica toursvirus 3a]